MKDKVTVLDQLELRSGGKRIISPSVEKDVVQVEGFFSAVCRERGKIVPGTRRQGKNIWTLTGREYLARLMSYSAYGVGATPDTPARNDRIRYLGLGVGTQPEVSTVTKLVTPVAFDAAGVTFLAELAIPSYPFQTSATAFGNVVRYFREYTESQISISGTVILTEAGLYTDGSPTASFAPKTRDLILANASAQAPAAYKSFEPLRKTQNFVLQASWEIRF